MSGYEMVVGLETHIELSTKTKIFCGCTTAFGGAPNTHCCPVCTGQPGALPRLNKRVVEYAVRAGLATHCTINNLSHMDRKNYVYPDLPKAYQISQYDEPLCKNGYVELDSGKKIRILRIHIEEDAGKLVHDGGNTFVDYNRGGVPLIEIVSEPDISSPDEAREYVEKLQIIMRFIGVSDCKMQEGSLRCDVNISLRPFGCGKLGTRAEIKNVNSVSFMVKALVYEYERQSDLLDSGKKVTQDTLRFDEESGTTSVMRRKEDAQDYRYFPEPDILPFTVTEEQVEKIRAEMPPLPAEKKREYLSYGLSEKIVEDIYKRKKACDLLDSAVRLGASAGKSASLIVGGIYSFLKTDEEKESFSISITAEQFAALVKYVDNGLDFSLAKKTLLNMLESGRGAESFLSEAELNPAAGDPALEQICRQVVKEKPQAVADFKGGRQTAIYSLYGAVKGKAGAKVNIKAVDSILRKIMEEEQ